MHYNTSLLFIPNTLDMYQLSFPVGCCWSCCVKTDICQARRVKLPGFGDYILLLTNKHKPFKPLYTSSVKQSQIQYAPITN